MIELNSIKFNKIINAKKKYIHCDVLGFKHKISKPNEDVVGFDTMVLQHLSKNVADLDKFIENFVKNNYDYKDYHLETHCDKIQQFYDEYIPDVITSKIVTEFVRKDEK